MWDGKILISVEVFMPGSDYQDPHPYYGSWTLGPK